MDSDFFEFKQVIEEPEKLDFNKLLPCPHCKKPIPHDSTMCFYCGEDVIFSKKPIWVAWVAGVLIIIFILFCMFAI